MLQNFILFEKQVFHGDLKKERDLILETYLLRENRLSERY